MPARKRKPTPRIHIRVEQQTYEVLKRMAELQGGSISGVAGPILDGVAPNLSRVVSFMEAAAEAPKKMQNQIKESLDQMEKQLLGIEHQEVLKLGDIEDRLKGKKAV